MAQQFNSMNYKTKTAVLIFGKNWIQPMVLYFENPNAVYEEIQNLIKTSSTTPKLVEYKPLGPIKKVTLLSNQIAGVALQEEPQLQ
ncbi:MAG: hypothetical protein E7Z91_01375 [Cyanobacteria bacterium SIG30]|nr:hypothetical protein [Cyanobacteria bacterium SIG30]